MSARPIALPLCGVTALFVGSVVCTSPRSPSESLHDEHVEVTSKLGVPAVSITLERTTCYGSCPAYTVQVLGTGTGIYEGRKYVVDAGPHEFDFDPARLSELVSQAEQILTTLDRRSAAWPITDVAYVQFVLTIDGQERRFQSPDFHGVFPDGMGAEDRELHLRIEALALEIDALGNVWPLVGTPAENRALYDAERGAPTQRARR